MIGSRTSRVGVQRRRAGVRTVRRSVCALLAVAGLTTIGCSDRKTFKQAIDVTGAGYARDFSLPDVSGKVRTLADFRGRYVLVFFGYAQCPDVCPTALTRAVEVRRLLGADGQKLQVIFITVDPERDTPGVLTEYMAAFDPSFIALRGDLQQTATTAQEFRVIYAKVSTGSSYAMDHTALSYVFDGDGRLRLALRHQSTAEQVAADLRTLMLN